MHKFIIFFFLVSIIGTYFHFVYKISKNNKIIGIFSSVNESTWEHIKLLLTPIFLVNTIWYIVDKPNNYFYMLFIEILLAIVLIIILFYGYKIIFKKDSSAIYNISIFYITILIISVVGNTIYKSKFNINMNYIGIIGSLIIFIMYLTFTIFPPKCFIFKDPISNKYGFVD